MSRPMTTVLVGLKARLEVTVQFKTWSVRPRSSIEDSFYIVQVFVITRDTQVGKLFWYVKLWISAFLLFFWYHMVHQCRCWWWWGAVVLTVSRCVCVSRRVRRRCTWPLVQVTRPSSSSSVTAKKHSSTSRTLSVDHHQSFIIIIIIITILLSTPVRITGSLQTLTKFWL